MALLDSAYKQRMVGALVLVALAVIFLPMLFSRQDEQRQVTVEAPAAPQAPVMPQVQVEPVVVPEPQALPEEEPVPTDLEIAEQQAPSTPIQPSVPVVKPTPAPVVAAKPVAPAPAPKPVAPQPAAPGKPEVGQSRIDPNGLPISWSVQLASLSNRESAEALQKTLRSQGYNAYIRTADGKNRVFVGPLIERAEADRLRDLLGRQQNLKGFVVRFQPERG
ncbi:MULTISPECIES: SPOR domain-containing protein [Pseudomonas]|uniref:SPOR domain-containing protein n=1 Tax=Pseudomonas gessardii TaxID=78544 RepID=A0A7Y1QQL6_9PSED|nr:MULTISPECIES: SPOR domain-containing protein [Pseudomonas]MBH3423489.1 SPOR domain-containing protein [Pseudomonas gessardii]MCF4980917.1 SPOR domain-containing protein [Pseudomonas gessardii]MCF4990173.1 SPOR domain-containing protein [Pseudomonas gessardii]MCF5086208.1 SPOR domain-containing protein [Pseudomonas gessardii]MCF5097631.1 SPOR domain-containing protein [Pseudomonas gessardii]